MLKKVLIRPGRYQMVEVADALASSADLALTYSPPCRFRLPLTGDAVECESCIKTSKRTEAKVFGCEKHGECVLVGETHARPIKVCRFCPDREVAVPPPISRPPTPVPGPPSVTATASEEKRDRIPGRKLRWAYGVTTVPERRDNLLVRTLDSLASSGFDLPWLFVDGDPGRDNEWLRFVMRPHPDGAHHEPRFAGLTFRYPRVGVVGNWWLALQELHLREPGAERYAIFQDDFVTGRNLRRYLEAVDYPERGYLNLFTFQSNVPSCPRDPRSGKMKEGWYVSNQLGRGAVALVFSRAAAGALLSAPHMVRKIEDVNRRHKAVDGGIIEAMREAGYQEYVHNPSLVQHTGEQSAMGNLPHAPSPVFQGEGYNYLDLIRG